MIDNLQHIVAACQRRESWAQRCIYDEYASVMLGVCMRYTRSRDEAQDLLHDGFIKVFEKIGQLEDPESLPGWVYKIMVNESLNYVKRNQQVEYRDMSVSEFADSDIPEEDEGLDTDNYVLTNVIEAIQSLPDIYRLAFNMHEVEEMEYDQISAEVGIPESTIRSRVSRAKKILREKLQQKEI